MVDVIVIGSGIAGCACARELSRYDLEIQVHEAGYDVACGATRTNSGIIHGGYDPQPGTLKAHYNVLGAQIVPGMARELGFRYKNNGSLVLAFSKEEESVLDTLMDRAWKNGVEGVEKLDREQVLALEPNCNPEVTSALFCPHSGIVDPFGMCVAYGENAAANGVDFHFLSKVTGVEKIDGGYRCHFEDAHSQDCRAVVNAAGVHALDFHNMVSANQLQSQPVLGEYELLSRGCGSLFSHVMFQVPSKKGKGVLISPTVEGNLIVGPDAIAQDDPDHTATTPEGLQWVVEAAKKTWPGFNRREVIVNFAGVRPSGADGDFVIGQPDDAPGFFDVAAFDSPGLTSAGAVAQDIAKWVSEYLLAGLNPHFKPLRKQPLRFIEMDDRQRSVAAAKDPRFAHIICRCEQVTEAEILEAIHSPLPATSIIGIKRRCRAGAGKCQGGFCTPLIAQIIARECGMGIDEVCLMGPGTQVAPFKRDKQV